MEGDGARWDARHAGRAATPAAPEALADHERLVAAGGLALDIACGLGGQSVWAAQQGFRVVAVDASPVAIAATTALADEHGVGDRVDARVHDLDDGLPQLAGPFDLVICQRFRDVDRYPDLAAALAPGGVLAISVLSVVGLDGDAGPFHAPPGELVTAFARFDLDLVASVERAGLASLLARRR